MKHYRIWLPLFLLILALGAMSVAASAAGTATVVYLADGGSGNGTVPERPVGTLTAAYDALDLTKDCTIVLCGKFTQTASFTYGTAYTGSVTMTSVYGGTDYRKSGAKLSVGGNMAFSNDTYFDNIDLAITKSALVFAGKFHNFGFGAGVRCEQAATATTFHYPIILAGVNTPASLTAANADADFTLTIAGGTWRSFYGGNRRTGASQVLGKVSGDSYIRIEGGTFTGSGGRETSGYMKGDYLTNGS